MSRKPEYYGRYSGFKTDCEDMCNIIEAKVFRNPKVIVTIHEMAPLSEFRKFTRGIARGHTGRIDIYLDNVWTPRVNAFNRMMFLYVLFHEYNHLLTEIWAQPVYETHKHFIELDMDRRAIEMMKKLESDYDIRLDQPPFYIPPCVSNRFIMEESFIILADWAWHLTMHTNNPVMRYPLDAKITQHLEADWRMASRMLSDIKGFDIENPAIKPIEEVEDEKANTNESRDGKGDGVLCQQSPARPTPINTRSSGLHQK